MANNAEGLRGPSVGNSGNQVYNNNFLANTIQATSGLGASFLNLPRPIGGNYWSDFDESIEGCDDLEPDNFCDAPFVALGGNTDNLPWTSQDGWLLPDVPDLACLGNGFQPPFHLPLSLKRQSNKAIPVKMVLEDVNGTVIGDGDLSAPPVVDVVFDFDPGDGMENDTMLVPPGLSDDGNAFRYDSAGGQWVINLATKQFSSPGTYTVTAVAGDETYEIHSSCSGTFVRLP